MAKADGQRSKNGADGRQQQKKRQKRRRTHRLIGLFAGLFTTAAITAAGYLALDYWVLSEPGSEPTLPIQIATVDGSRNAAQTTQEPDKEETAEPDFTESSASSSEMPPVRESTEPASEEETASKEELSTEVSEEAQETTKELSESEKKDLELREKALAKFDNLGIVVKVKNYLNMRTGPSTDDEICGKIFPYCGVNIIKDAENGWYQIESGGVVGYVAKQYIETGTAARSLALEHCRYQGRILPETVDVLKKPDEESEVIVPVKKDDYYDIFSIKDGWVEIEVAETLGGYVRAEDVEILYRLEEAIVFDYDDSISQTRVDIINKAFDYYGNPYVFGGRDFEKGIDCSAFTYKIYAMFDIDLVEMYSITQSTVGKEVSEEDIRPGDLLFYVGRIPAQIGHVAIYIGNGKIIHAASESKGICVSDWKYVPIVTIRDVIGER